VIGTHRHRSTAPRLYILDSLCLPSSTSSSTSRVLSASSVRAAYFAQWHHFLGHLCASCLSTLIKSTCLGHTSSESSFHCKGCHLGKQIPLPYFTSDSHSARPFDLVHSDGWGLAPLVSKGGNKYYVIFVDECSRNTWIYSMKRRYELLSICILLARFTSSFMLLLRFFRFNSSGEYLSDSLRQFLTLEGSLAQLLFPSSHAQNGVLNASIIMS
jgi:hypothetical protein